MPRAREGFIPFETSRPGAVAAVRNAQGESRTGFTLFEVVLTLTFLIILAAIVLPSFFSSRGQTQLNLTARHIAALLREAQSRSVAQSSSTMWGVHFEIATTTAPFYALFAGTYASSSVIAYYRLPATLRYVTATFPFGEIREISFSQLTGLSSASTSLGIFLSTNRSASATIHVASSGAVTY